MTTTERSARLPLVLATFVVGLGLVAVVLVLVLAGGENGDDGDSTADGPHLGASNAEVSVRAVEPRSAAEKGASPEPVEPPAGLTTPGEYCDGNVAVEPPAAFDAAPPRVVVVARLAEYGDSWQVQFAGTEEPWGKDAITTPEQVNLVACTVPESVHEDSTKQCERREGADRDRVEYELVAADYSVEFVTPEGMVVGEGEISVGQDCPLLVDRDGSDRVVATPTELDNTKLVNAFLALQ